MKSFIVYLSSGQIIRSGICQEDTFDLQASDDELIIEGSPAGSQYVENGLLVDMPPKPEGFYDFDYAVKQWVINEASAIAAVTAKRNELLKNGPDRVNPLWWAAMTAAEQADVTAYRQALLDITNQPGYPHSVTWPPIPQVFLPSTGI